LTSWRFSSGFITLPATDWLRLEDRVRKAGLPEVGIPFGAGRATGSEEAETEGTRDPGWPIRLAQRFLDSGAYMILIESEGITENVKQWRTDVPAGIINAFGLKKLMPRLPIWKFSAGTSTTGTRGKSLRGSRQIVRLECLRSGIWGTASLLGRVVTYKG
jgi:phosphosulfolactate synthase (CoM biosynthesis protein A)